MITVAIDVGSSKSGMCVIDLAQTDITKKIIGANLDNGLIIPYLKSLRKKFSFDIVIEDIRGYVKMSKYTLDTVKYIGELTYRIKSEVGMTFNLMTRSEVRQWIFNRFNELCVEKIDKKIAYTDNWANEKNEALISEGKKAKYRRQRNKNGELRKASFNYVDDWIIITCMKEFWEIPKSKPYKQHPMGLSKDAWQALALGTAFIHRDELTGVDKIS